jgi:hypothetical protein
MGIPTYQTIPSGDLPQFADPAQLYGQMFTGLNPYLTQFSNLQARQSAANTNLLDQTRLADTKRGMRQITRQTLGLEKRYAPQYAQLYTNILNQVNPGYSDLYSKLGQKVSQDLDLGYSMSPAMQAQVQQDIRGAQDARGNWFGPAPTADEAYGSAQARQQLYQNRLQNAEGFLSARSPADMLAQIRGNTAATQGWNVEAAPSYVDPGAIASAMGMQYGNQQNAFNNKLAAYGFNNQWKTQDWSNSLYQNALGGAGAGGGGSAWGNAGMGALSGAASGAMTGMAAGPYGALIGAGIGAVAGGVGGYMSGNTAGAAMGGAAGGISAGATGARLAQAYSYNPYYYGGGIYNTGAGNYTASAWGTPAQAAASGAGDTAAPEYL